jgi:hypothetical protein
LPEGGESGDVLKAPSTGNDSPPGGAQTRRDGSGQGESRTETRATVDGGRAPREPHERDESSDSGTGGPNEVMRRAHDDVVSGKTGTDKGEVTEQVYERHLRGETPGAERD